MAIVLKFKTKGRDAIRGMKKVVDKGKRELSDFRRKASRDAEKVQRKWRSFNKTLGKVGLSYKRIGIAAGAMATVSIYAITRLSSKAIKLFGEQEMAEKKLEAALGGVNRGLLDQASALQQVSLYGDETIIEAMALIGAFEKDEEAIKRATKATLDLAAAKGFDLVAAADLVSKTLGSTTNALTRYGIEVTGAVGSTERLDTLTQNIAKLFGGQATAQTEVYLGAVEQLGNEYGDLFEDIGEKLVPVLTDHLIPRLRDTVGEMSAWVEQNDELIEQGMATVVDGIATSAETAAGMIKTVAEYWRLAAIGAAITRGEGEKIIEFYRILQSEQGGTNEGLDYQRDRTGEIKGFWEGVAEVYPQFADRVPQTNDALKDQAGLTEEILANLKQLDPAQVKMIPRMIKFRSEAGGVKDEIEDTVDLIDQEVSGVEALSSTFAILNLQGNAFTASLQEQVGFMRTMQSIISGITNIFGFLGVFHTGGMVNRIPGVAPGYAPPGTRQYHSGGVQMGADERLGRFKVGESVINPFGTAMLGRQGVAALNAGMMPSGGNKYEFHFYNTIGTEEWIADNIPPMMKKMVTELNMEVWASDTIRSRSLSTS